MGIAKLSCCPMAKDFLLPPHCRFQATSWSPDFLTFFQLHDEIKCTEVGAHTHTHTHTHTRCEDPGTRPEAKSAGKDVHQMSGLLIRPN